MDLKEFDAKKARGLYESVKQIDEVLEAIYIEAERGYPCLAVYDKISEETIQKLIDKGFKVMRQIPVGQHNGGWYVYIRW